MFPLLESLLVLGIYYADGETDDTAAEAASSAGPDSLAPQLKRLTVGFRRSDEYEPPQSIVPLPKAFLSRCTSLCHLSLITPNDLDADSKTISDACASLPLPPTLTTLALDSASKNRPTKLDELLSTPSLSQVTKLELLNSHLADNEELKGEILSRGCVVGGGPGSGLFYTDDGAATKWEVATSVWD